ncbi:MAG: hypothetical protein ACRELA_08760 [Candidatus Rokuibacteriota bacterium]
MGGNGGDVTGHNRNAWLKHTDLEEWTAALPLDEQAIVVLPDPGLYVDSIDGSLAASGSLSQSLATLGGF